MEKQDMIRRMSGFVRDTMKESGETVFGAPQFVTRKQVATFMGKKDPHQRVGGHKKVISYFLRNGVASVTPFPVSAVLPQE